MAPSNGVPVLDPLLASKFTQGELKTLRAQFEVINSSGGGLATPKELDAGLAKLGFRVSADDLAKGLQEYDKDLEGGLNFEGFLQLRLDIQKGRSPKTSPRPSMATSFTIKRAESVPIHQTVASEKRAYVDHINSCLHDDSTVSKVLPIDPSGNQLYEAVKDGVVLCKLINVAVPGTIDERVLNIKERLNPWEKTENLTLCLNSAKAIGCSVVNIGAADIIDGREHLILGLISQIVKIQLLANVNVKKMPELAELLKDQEDFEELLNLPAEKVLLRWMNFHLVKAAYKGGSVTNFSNDIKDGAAYTVLLNHLAPESCSLEPLEANDPLDRAKQVLAMAERIGCKKYIQPKDIIEGSTNLNLAFVANLFHERSGLKLDESKMALAEMIQDDEQDSREERAFRMWINSLGIETFVNNLFEGIRDGYVLLEVLDKLKPGSVNWKQANKPPIKLPFKKVENCNQAIEIGKTLKFSLVGIGGNDIVQGNKKLILAVLWQLMQYNMLQMLKNLRQGVNGKGITDADIISWANDRVKGVGKPTKMESFKDKSLSSGIFFLDLLGAIEPRVVNWNLITKGQTPEDKELNAKYIISVARKLGCSVFLLWDDIVEVRPKMILTLTASIMLWSLSNKLAKASGSAPQSPASNPASPNPATNPPSPATSPSPAPSPS